METQIDLLVQAVTPVTPNAGETRVFINSSKTVSSVDDMGVVTNYGSATGGDASANIGYLNIPQVSQSVNYTTVLTDSGKCIFHPVADNNSRTFTIASNATVPYPIGTVLVFKNNSAAALSIAIASDTLTLDGAGTTGTRTLAQYGKATAMKETATTWSIGGVNLT